MKGKINVGVFHLKLSKVEQTGQLEGAPFTVINPRTEEVERKGGRHGAEELKHKKNNVSLPTAITKHVDPHTSTYHFPRKGLVPEGRALLQAEERAPYRCPESSRHPGRCPRRDKIPLISKEVKTSI